eukprot:359219-Chlamydomonas_euryale.AAC.25
MSAHAMNLALHVTTGPAKAARAELYPAGASPCGGLRARSTATAASCARPASGARMLPRRRM